MAEELLPVVRTRDEAHLYMDLHPCERCGSVDTEWDSGLVAVEGELARSYSGTCGKCGLERQFVFRVLDPPLIAPAGSRVFFGTDQHSELLDAGEWLWVADLAASNAPADDRDGEAQALAIAAAAMDEILKFIPDGADRVPDGAFWSERGTGVRGEAPGRFDRDRLEVVRDSYRRQLADVEGRG